MSLFARFVRFLVALLAGPVAAREAGAQAAAQAQSDKNNQVQRAQLDRAADPRADFDRVLDRMRSGEL